MLTALAAFGPTGPVQAQAGGSSSAPSVPNAANAASPAPVAPALAPGPPVLEKRWIYLPTNHLVDANITQAIALLDRAAAAHYNGVLVTDSKFTRWDALPQHYADNVRQLREACRERKMEYVACVFGFGYSNDLLSRDPNLAEGLPVRGAPFVVRGGVLVPDDPIALANGDFEQFQGDKFAGWQFADLPGKVTFVDTQVVHHGKASLRMDDIGTNNPESGNGRISQKLRVEPFRYYHASVMVKTQDFERPAAIRIQALAPGGVSLCQTNVHVKPTQDWQRLDVTFNTLEAAEITFYLGVWGGGKGRIWWDDARLEPAGLVNVVRRPGAPLAVTNDDGATTYEEGRDFDGARDPLLGIVPWPGEYSVWHDAPRMTVPAGSRLAEGQRVRLSYYHTEIIGDGQVPACMGEPKLTDILRWEAEQVATHCQPDGYLMSHDEIRIAGWDPSCLGETGDRRPGDLLAENVARCVAILREVDPGKQIYAWSDMFDPFHNAREKGSYYLVRGDGPWYGSWKGLPSDVIVANWNGGGKSAERIASLRHFASLGHRQILAGYYDADPTRITPWLEDAAQAGGVVGAIYTTWQQKYDDLEAFGKLLPVP
jgi:hypothetical protein